MSSTSSTHQPEAFSRVLIDRALADSGWDLLDSQQVQFEFHTKNGRADYLLKDSLGRTLCVLEAKREELDPYDASKQLRRRVGILDAWHAGNSWRSLQHDRRLAARKGKGSSAESVQVLF